MTILPGSFCFISIAHHCSDSKILERHSILGHKVLSSRIKFIVGGYTIFMTRPAQSISLKKQKFERLPHLYTVMV